MNNGLGANVVAGAGAGPKRARNSWEYDVAEPLPQPQGFDERRQALFDRIVKLFRDTPLTHWRYSSRYYSSGHQLGVPDVYEFTVTDTLDRFCFTFKKPSSDLIDHRSLVLKLLNDVVPDEVMLELEQDLFNLAMKAYETGTINDKIQRLNGMEHVIADAERITKNAEPVPYTPDDEVVGVELGDGKDTTANTNQFVQIDPQIEWVDLKPQKPRNWFWRLFGRRG